MEKNNERKPALLYPVIVEGKYDKIKLSSLFEGQILQTDGFGVFKNEEKRIFFKKLAERSPLIVFTDSDGGGLVIRNYFKSILPKDRVIHLYIPQVKGKEARKSAPSKEGFLGVEGTDSEILRNIFAPYLLLEGQAPPQKRGTLTKLTLYELGYDGGDGSKEKRQALLQKCGLPSTLSTKALLEALNLLYTDEELEELL
jgi:ribonuclease M5